MQIAAHTFFITGASSGLGEATAILLAKNNANIVIADLNANAGNELIKRIGRSAKFIKTDVIDEGSVQAAINQTLAMFGNLSGVINCAGILLPEKVLGKNGPHNYDTFKRSIEVNLFGTFNVIRIAAESMAKNRPSITGERGVIINTSSIAAFEGQIGQAAYAASKAGINGMTLPIARELAKHGIRVVSIAPGLFNTPMMQSLSEEARASLGAQVPFPARLGNPEEYAELAKHIIENELLNGTVIRLDGAIRMAPK